MGLPLPYPFDRDFMQLALVAGLVVGICAPLIGNFLVQRQMSLMGDGIGHVAFAGVSAGLLADVWPIWTALGFAVAGSVAVEWLRAKRQASADFALAVLFYSGIAGGVVLASLAGSLNASAVSYLFGSILTVTTQDAIVVSGLGIGIVAVMLFTHRALFSVTLDEEAARVNGLPVMTLNIVLAVVTALTVVAGMRVVGVLLVAALMVLPVGSAQAIAGSFVRAAMLSAFIGTVSVVVGLAAARIWGLAPGGSIVLVAAAIFVVTSIAKSARS